MIQATSWVPRSMRGSTAAPYSEAVERNACGNSGQIVSFPQPFLILLGEFRCAVARVRRLLD